MTVKDSFDCVSDQARQQPSQQYEFLYNSTSTDQLNYMLSHLDWIPDVCNEKIHVGLPLPENELNSLLMVSPFLCINSSLICVLFIEANIPHHQLCFADAGIISARIHHIVVRPFHTEHTSRVLPGSFVDFSRRVHVPHNDASVHRSRNQSISLRGPTDGRHRTLMSQPFARHHGLLFPNLPHFDFAACVAHSDVAIVRRDSQRVDLCSVVFQLVRSHGACIANSLLAQFVHFHILASILL